MATTSFIAKTVMGDKRVNLLRVTTGGAEEVVDTGLAYVEAFSVGNVKCTDATYSMRENVGTTSTANAGKLDLSGMATGDIFFITVFGH